MYGVLPPPILAICKGLKYNVLLVILFTLFGSSFAFTSAPATKEKKLLTNPPALINLPTEDYGTRQVENFIEDHYHKLICSIGRTIKTYDGKGQHWILAMNEANIPKFFYSNENDQWTNQADKGVFQAHWIAEKIAGLYYDNLGINFSNVKIGANVTNIQFAGTPTSSTMADTKMFLSFRTLSNGQKSTYAVHDVIGHEFAHTWLLQYLKTDQIASHSLHEAIADMFGVYMEYLYEKEGNPNASINWKIGEDVDPPDYYRRDLENPDYPCFNDEVRAFTDEYDRSQPLGHWFYLLTMGPKVTETPCVYPIGIERAIMIVKKTVEQLNNQYSDYEHFRDVSLKVVTDEIGLDSEEANTLRWAWNKICLPTTTIIKSNVVWNGLNCVFDNIELGPSVELELLNSTLAMLPNAKIITAPSSSLYIRHSHLKSCNKEKWHGIISNDFPSQDNLTLWFVTIENSKEGVFIDGKKSFIIEQSTFIKNDIGIYVKNCIKDDFFDLNCRLNTFTNNTIGIKSENTRFFKALDCTFSGLGTSYTVGFLSNNSSDAILESCTFSKLAYGVSAVNSIIIDNKSMLFANLNQFLNCRYGILAMTSGEGIGTVEISDNNYFSDCASGIDLSGIDMAAGAIIKDNLFENCGAGTYFLGSNTFNVIDNTFYYGEYGSICTATGGNQNTIDCNYIHSPHVDGIALFEDNYGTSFMGNSFNYTGENDIYIDGSVQYEIGATDKAPLNNFSTNHTNDITITSNTEEFKYYIPPTPPANTDPDNSESSDIPQNWEDYTNSEYQGPNCEIPRGNVETNIIGWFEYYCHLLNEYKLNPNLILERRIKLLESDIKRKVWDIFINLCKGEKFTRGEWIRFWNMWLSWCDSYFMKKQIYYMSLKMGDCKLADSLLTVIDQSLRIPGDGTRMDSLDRIDKQSFVAINRIGHRYYCDQLRIDTTWISRDSFRFTSQDIATLHDETYRLIPESAYARTLYYLATNELLMPTLGDMQFRSNSPAKSIAQVEMSVYPNPADGKVAISFNTPLDGMLTVYDILGNTLLKDTLSKHTIYEDDTALLKNGIYIVTVSSDEGNIIKSEKIVINH